MLITKKNQFNHEETTSSLSISILYAPRKVRPFKVSVKEEFIFPCEDRDDERRINYPSEKIYGNTLNFEKTFGCSSKGVLINNVTKQVVKVNHKSLDKNEDKDKNNSNDDLFAPVEFGVSRSQSF